ncbi:MAG: hypothetical protein GXX85_17720 [Ignavibacteria bacterium]|nr:hypothetical protein [Ignavibacteria bacterium]
MKATELTKTTNLIKESYLAEFSKIPEMREYKDDIRLGKQREIMQGMRERAIERIEKNIKDIETEISQITDAINAVKYPELLSLTGKQYGATEIQTAKIFLSSKKTHEKILNEIADAMDLKRTDYLSALIEEILSNRIGTEQDATLKQAVLERISGYKKYNGLNELETERQALRKCLENAHLTRSYLTSLPLNGIKNFQDFSNTLNNM